MTTIRGFHRPVVDNCQTSVPARVVSDGATRVSDIDRPSLQKISRKSIPFIPDSFQDQGYCMIGQRSYMLIKSGHAKFNKAFTMSVNTCVMLTLYDRTTGSGMMAHFDAGTYVEEGMKEMFDALKKMGADTEHLEVRMIGGDGNIQFSVDLVNSMTAELEKYGIQEADYKERIVLTSDREYQFVLDASDGELYTFDDCGEEVKRGFSYLSRGRTMLPHSKIWGDNSPDDFNAPSDKITLELFQNYPNPATGTTSIPFKTNSTEAKLVITDMLGRTVKTFELANLQPGTSSVTWDASGENSGVYNCTLIAGDKVQTRQTVVVK